MAFSKEENKLKKEDDKAFVRRILKGEEQAWAEFVDRFTDWVFYTANKWTDRPGSVTDWSERRVVQNGSAGKKYSYTEEALDTYLWILEQLRKKLKFYTGRRGANLSTYVWTVLNSKNLFVDYLRWKYGDPRKIPKALQKATRQEKKVFVLLRMRKSIEQIASELHISFEKAETITRQVIEKLIKAGLEDLVLPHTELELSEDLINILPMPVEFSEDDRIVLREACARFGEAVNELPPEEQALLKLAYDSGLSAMEILEDYRMSNMKFPGEMPPEKLLPKDVYKIIANVKKKLLALFQKKCEHFNDLIADNQLINTLLDQLGVEFK